jgi:hypothetical protein
MKKSVLFCFGLIATLLWGACNKADEIGNGILPADDIPGLLFSDTASIVSFCITDDSIKSGGVTNKTFLTSVNPVGAQNDATFGTTVAALYAQVDLSKTSFDFGTNFIADSLVLTMAYKEVFGDTNSPVTFHVYRLNDKISSDSIYFTSKDYFTYNAQEIGSATMVLRPKDSIIEYDVKRAPHIRIKLDPALTAEFASKTQSNELKINDDFLNFFKGIYITADVPSAAGSGFIFTLDYKSVASRMALFYHNDAGDSAIFAFPFNDYNRVNRFKHDYSATAIAAQLADSTMGSEYSYLQSLGGLQTKIKLPYLKDYNRTNKRAINKAQLIIQADNSEVIKYAAHKTISVFTANGSNQITDKFRILPMAYDSAKSQYIADITVYAQQSLTGKYDDLGLILKANGALVNAYRTRLFGNSPIDKRMKLKLYFTEY